MCQDVKLHTILSQWCQIWELEVLFSRNLSRVIQFFSNHILQKKKRQTNKKTKKPINLTLRHTFFINSVHCTDN